MYPKFKEIALDTATWTVAFLGAIEERETKSKKPFCTFHLLDGDIAITANLWNTEKKDIYKVQEKSVISVQLYKKLYNGVETYEVKEYQAAPDDAKLEDYLLTAPIPSQDMMDEIKSMQSGHFIKPAYAYSWTYSVARYELRNLRVLFCKWKCNCVKCLRKWSFKLYSVA